MNVKQWYDRVFGNNDGKFDLKDLPNSSVLIVGIVVDIVMLAAEYRVWSVGYKLTNNWLLAIGFVLVSSLPFFLGQLAYRYNRANGIQQTISILLVTMGLLVSAYYGFADYILSTNTTLDFGAGVSIPLDVSTLYAVAVAGTVSLIVSGLLYIFLDDEFANTLRMRRIQGKADIANKEIEIKRGLLANLKKMREEESDLAREYPEDYNALQAQFEALANKANKQNPTGGNGSRKL